MAASGWLHGVCVSAMLIPFSTAWLLPFNVSVTPEQRHELPVRVVGIACMARMHASEWRPQTVAPVHRTGHVHQMPRPAVVRRECHCRNSALQTAVENQ